MLHLHIPPHCCFLPQGAYAPCIQMGKQLITYENDVSSITAAITKAAQAIIVKYNASAVNGLTGTLTTSQVNKIASYLTSTANAASTEIGLKTQTGEQGRRQGPSASPNERQSWNNFMVSE